MNNVIIGVLLFCWLWACIRWFLYYCLTQGLIYYLISEHNDWLENGKAKELTKMVTEKTIKEFFGKR